MTPHVIAVHGFAFGGRGRHSPEARFRPEIEAALGDSVELFAWDSVPVGWDWSAPRSSLGVNAVALLRSWAGGYLHPYRLAWDLASTAAADLARQLRTRHAAGWPDPDRVVLLGHSLGSRVCLLAALQAPQAIERIVLLSGAELVRNAAAWAPMLGAAVLRPIPVVNIATREDDILSLFGAHCSGDGDGACIGQAGLGSLAPHHWLDLVLDDPETQGLGRQRGWDLQGDKPGEWGDHWHCYRHPGNRGLIRAAVAGDGLEDFRPSPSVPPIRLADCTT